MKYRNKPTTIDGVSFASKLEADRWKELRLLERAGEIKDLQKQVTYRLDVNGTHICKYIADFVYTTKHGAQVVEDTKSPATITTVYTMKERLMKAVHGIVIQRVYRRQVGR